MISSPRKRNALPGCQSPSRPPCRTKLVQPWSAFQMTVGRNTAPPSTLPSQGAGARSHVRIDGVTSSHSMMPNQSRAAVYLLAIARPPNRPTASHQPSRHLGAAAFAGMTRHPRQCPQASGPEHQQRRVGRHHHGADAEQQRRIEHHRGMQASLAVRQQVLGGIGEQQRSDGDRKRAEQPDAQRSVTGQAGAEADPDRHHRRMVRVTGGEGPRPHPVVGLVRGQWGDRRDDETQQRQCGERGQCPACRRAIRGSIGTCRRCARRDDRLCRAGRYRARQTSVAETA